MTDIEIIDLYWQRSENAISETDKSYGKFCLKIANGILSNREDSEESVNDSYLAVWNNIPPTRPDSLKAYLAKLVRRISISHLRRNNAKHRGGGEAAIAIEELADCIPSEQNVEDEILTGDLARTINRFLGRLERKERVLFVARYWYVMPIEEIARRYGTKESTVKTSVYRTRRKLKEYLEGQI